MVIKVLAEDTALSTQFQFEHGLSLYIETSKYKLLFDMGKSGLFLANAKKMKVDIADVDFAVISHGHYDHGGGLECFLKENCKAKIYLHEKAFEKHLARRPNGRLDDIGLDSKLKSEKRLVLTGDRCQIAEGAEVFSNVKKRELFSSSNHVLLTEKDGQISEDTFEHEQNLVITENGKSMLFAGCAHSGIVNIVNRFAEIKHGFADAVFGGFHLHNPSAGQSEPEELTMQIAEYLKQTHSKYFTCHCTGMEAYQRLKSVMGDQLEYISAGSVINL